MSTTYRPSGTSRGTVFFGVGHGGSDPGASKYLVEKNLNLEQAMCGKDYMVANGFTVVMSRVKDENDPLTEEIKEANAVKNLLCAVDWHNNAGGGDGFEAYYGIGSNTNGSKGLAQSIETQVKAIGQNSRGCKTRRRSDGKDYYGFIRQVKTRAVIIEGCFVDNKTDASDFDTPAENKEYGYAVAKGVINWLESTGRVSKKIQVTPSGSTSFASNSSTNNKYIVGNVYTIVAKSGVKVRAGAGTNYRQKKRSELTADGKKHAKIQTYATLKNGTRVTCKSVKTVDGDTWLQIPSGYVCAVYNGNVYIK